MPPLGTLDSRLIQRALALATLGTGTAAPNPRVGAVVARGTRVIGQGYHRRPGEPHAEALALDHAESGGGSASGATLYTTLEPCCHTGRTPPCVDRIVRARIARVVASMKDPNPLVNGGGFRVLRRGFCGNRLSRSTKPSSSTSAPGFPW
jgi:diaminohydroxyphosphoribosylaminopyrimidine deaminase/5-amino-6-(5-phosphoribosylamino)uracil reductase